MSNLGDSPELEKLNRDLWEGVRGWTDLGDFEKTVKRIVELGGSLEDINKGRTPLGEAVRGFPGRWRTY